MSHAPLLTSIGMLKESHISIHTYPEYNCIQIDFFSCKELNKRQNVEYIERVFKKSEAEKAQIQFNKDFPNLWSHLAENNLTNLF